MHREDVLDKHLKNEYLLLKLLYISSKEMTKKEICEELKITMPTLSRVIAGLRESLEESIQTSQIEFNVKKSTLELKSINNISLDELMGIFMKQSSKYKVLRYLFSHQRINHVELCNLLNVSNTTLNRVLQSCNNLLFKYNLKIERGKIIGDITQYVFFYYTFLWVSEATERKVGSGITYAIVDEMAQKFELTLMQKKQLYLWLLVTLKKINKVKIEELNQINQKNIQQYNKTPINQYVQHLLEKNNPLCTSDELQIFSYLTCLFLTSFGIISYERIQLGLFCRDNPAFELTNKIMAAIKVTFNLDQSTVFTIETSVFSLIAQTYYFTGSNYTTDKLTFAYYYRLFNNSFRERFVGDIIENIIMPSYLFDQRKTEYIKKRLVLLIYILSPKKEYQVKIGVVSSVSYVLASSTIFLLENELSKRQDVILEPYTDNNCYDLVISNLTDNLLIKNYNYFYQLTTIGVNLDVKELHDIINEIAISKYQSFVL